jgi:hypothetical protein
VGVGRPAAAAARPALHRDRPKNWDTLAALGAILRRTERSGSILDAGTAMYSTMLPLLWRYGYKRLTGINVEFRRPFNRGRHTSCPAT